MKAFLLLLLINIAMVSNAQTVSVASGEHEAFSRLVFTFPSQPEWSLVRNSAGYSFIVKGNAPQYDLSEVYRRISNNRLKSIIWNAESASLQLEVVCPCYAMPFELRNGVVVIDIKDGQAPEGSSFEQTATGDQLPPIAAPADVPALSAPTDSETGLPEAIASATRAGNASSVLDIEVAPALDGLKDDLLWQLSKGAARGVVDVALPDPRLTKPSAQKPSQDNIRIGGPPGFNPAVVTQDQGQMTGTGNACLNDADLDIASWASAENVVAEFANNTTGLVGEFDRPEPEKLSHAIRYYISLGFGAEARLLLSVLEIAADDRALWETMAHIVDLETPPGSTFSEMEGCDTYAALWSILAGSTLPPLKTIAIPAVLRAFSALPLHLRRHFGPGLADRFLEQNDAATARAIRDSILRAPGAHGPSVDLLEAEIVLASGNIAKAEALLDPIVGTTGPAGLASTIASIQLLIGSGREVPLDLTTTAEALLQETAGGIDEIPLGMALASAYASQNRYEEAFGILEERSLDNALVWQMLANGGADSELITFAIFRDVKNVPLLASETERGLAQRLIALGFPDSALYWLSPLHRENQGLVEADRLMIAQAELQRKDARAVIGILDGLQTEDATRLRGQALAMLGVEDAAKTFESIGLTGAAAQVARHQGRWPELAALEVNDVWKEAAALVTATNKPGDETEQSDSQPMAAQGELATARHLLNESSNTRDLLEKLISEQSRVDLQD